MEYVVKKYSSVKLKWYHKLLFYLLLPFTLGKFQRKWALYLMHNPEKQTEGALGMYKDETRKDIAEACCLGAGLFLKGLAQYNLNKNQGLAILENLSDYTSTTLYDSFDKLGLKSPHGAFTNDDNFDSQAIQVSSLNHSSLVNINDRCKNSWQFIAYLMVTQPKLIFTKRI